ncbi:MAG: hypothetical protein KDB80_08690, partial [Planctomycetes bacterium]|nr:hypothetical protein [Planctomycetota bacterium]
WRKASLRGADRDDGMTDPRDTLERPDWQDGATPQDPDGGGLRLLPPPSGEALAESGPPARARLIREYKGHAVPDPTRPRPEPQHWLPGDEDAPNVVAGPGFGRRRSIDVLWPWFGLIAAIVASAVWIAIC